jgi:LmbE family N-acetylglucosaminyl deacetylase
MRYVPSATSRVPAHPVPPQLARGLLPRATTVLAVIARPGQESADLGALLFAFRRSGARLAVLSLTRGEASPLNSTIERLESRRLWELQVAAGLLGVTALAVADYPDGRLARCPAYELTELVGREIRRHAADLVVIIDPVPDGSDDTRSDDTVSDDTVVAGAARAAAAQAGVPTVARMTLGTGTGRLVPLGPEATVARAVQRSAAAAHSSQAEAMPEVERRLSALGDGEMLRWLAPAAS